MGCTVGKTNTKNHVLIIPVPKFVIKTSRFITAYNFFINVCVSEVMFALQPFGILYFILIVACAVQPLEVFVFVDVVPARGESLLCEGKDDKILILPSAFGVNSVFIV